MKTILLSVKTFPPNFTGAGLRALRLSERMHKKYGFHFRVLCTDASDEKDLHGNHLTVKRIPFSLNNPLLKPLAAVIVTIKIYRYLQKNADNIDVIHFFSFGITNRIIMAINLLTLKKKTILEITQDGDDDPISLTQKGIKNTLLKIWTLGLLKKIDRFTVLSQFSYDSCVKINISPSKIWYRPNPIDEKFFGEIPFSDKQAIRKNLGIPDKFILLNVGLIQPRKNQLFLCECIKLLNDDAYILVLIGPTKKDFTYYQKNIVEYLTDNGLKGKILLLGHVDNINEYMVAADALVFASKNEGFCNVLAESTMSGLPILSLYSNGYAPYVNTTTGVMFSEQETHAHNVMERLVKEIGHLKDRYADINREAIRQYAKDQFSTKKIDAGYKAIYDNLTVRSNSA